MSRRLLPGRKTRSLGRPRHFRDDRIFYVATEDRYAPEQYFRFFDFDRVQVIVLPTGENCRSAPMELVERIKNERREANHETWILFDEDHHFEPNHIQGTIVAIQAARQAGIQIAVSAPCFELWLLLHHQEVTAPMRPKEAEHQLRSILSEYNKTSLQQRYFTVENQALAMERAQALDTNQQLWPENPGTHLYKLLTSILAPPETE